MLERHRYPPGVPCWVDTEHPDPAAAATFYGGLFGWDLADRMTPEAPGRYFIAQLHGRDVAAVGSQARDGRPAVWNTYIAVDSADDAVARVTAARGTTVVAPYDIPDAGRAAMFADPSGAVFGVWQADRRIGAQLVNEPGTWNWSDLSTDDPQGAGAFYTAVFGWIAEPVDMGGAEATMWRLPGYGDFLATLEPGIRERQAESGAPTGFEDAIGWMMPLTSEQVADGVAPHWGVTFTVADTDAIAASAVALGGEVVVAPYDAGPVRSAVLSDPQGAVFSVNTFNPDADG